MPSVPFAMKCRYDSVKKVDFLHFANCEACFLFLVGTSTIYVVGHHQICICSSLFAYCSDWSITKKGKYLEFSMGYSD